MKGEVAVEAGANAPLPGTRPLLANKLFGAFPRSFAPFAIFVFQGMEIKGREGSTNTGGGEERFRRGVEK